MIFHASIPADDPERVARVIAELWRGEYLPFIFPQTFIVFANDDRASEVEIGPRGHVLIPANGQVGSQFNASSSPYSEVHLNIATPLSLEDALAIAEREGWAARLCDRGGDFTVIEFWLENKFMLELMTELELKRYRNVTSVVWRARIAQGQQTLPVSSMSS
jgi:hypothetical protein